LGYGTGGESMRELPKGAVSEHVLALVFGRPVRDMMRRSIFDVYHHAYFLGLGFASLRPSLHPPLETSLSVTVRPFPGQLPRLSRTEGL
jgi:hypothetical protein